MKRMISIIKRGKVTVLAVVVALVLVGAPAALAANGDNFILGRNNVATAITKLAGRLGVDGPMLRIINNNGGANATALDLRVEPGKAPLRVNSGVKVNNLNADRLDGLDSTAFGQPIAFGMQSTAGIIGSSAANYRFTPAFTPPASGKCLVTVSTQIQNGPGDDNSTLGPSYRVAVQRGPSVSTDGLREHLFPPYSGQYSGGMTRSAVFDVNGGQPTQFGAFFGSPQLRWQNDIAIVHVTYVCTTPGSGAA